MSRTLIKEGLIALKEQRLGGNRRAISSGMKPNPWNKTMRDLYSIPGFAKSRGIGGLGLTHGNYSDNIKKYFKDRRSPRIDYNPTWNEYESARDIINQQNKNSITRRRKLEQLDKYFDYYNPFTNELRPEFKEYEV